MLPFMLPPAQTISDKGSYEGLSPKLGLKKERTTSEFENLFKSDKEIKTDDEHHPLKTFQTEYRQRPIQNIENIFINKKAS
jgi:hypothetical protein